MVGVWFVVFETMRNIIMQIMIQRSSYLHVHSCFLVHHSGPTPSLIPFLSFVLSGVNPCSPNCGKIAEKIGEKSWAGKERKSRG